MYQCPDCYAVQPEPGRCGRCPGITRPTGAIVFDDVDHNASSIRNALRKLDPLDPDRTAAAEALGFFIHTARKEAAK